MEMRLHNHIHSNLEILTSSLGPNNNLFLILPFCQLDVILHNDVLMNHFHFASFYFSPIVALVERRVKQHLHVADEFFENTNPSNSVKFISCREI
jgi:hypothetical protein